MYCFKNLDLKKKSLLNPYLKSIKKINITQINEYISDSIFIVPCDSGFNIEIKFLEKRVIRYNLFDTTGLIHKECDSDLINKSEIKGGYSYNILLYKIKKMIFSNSINQITQSKKEIPEYLLKFKGF